MVSLGAKLRDKKCKQVRDWFVNNEFCDFGDWKTGLAMYRKLPKEFVESPQARANVVEFFSSFDDKIIDFHVEKIPTENDEEKLPRYKVSSVHKMIGSNETAEIPLEEESAGMLKMFALYPELQSVLRKGGVYFVDELNARLHPLLVRNFVLAFLNPSINIHHAQLVFTTHDTWLLSNRLFRRDEIWFVEKTSKAYRLCIRWLILWMMTANGSERTRTMRNTIC